MKTKRRKRKKGIRRCRSCGEIIYMEGEWLSENSRITKLCSSCNFIDCGGYGASDRRVGGDIGDMLFYSDLDEFDREMIGDDPYFDLEDYL